MASLLQAGAQEATRIPDRRLVHALQVSEPGVGRATRTRAAGRTAPDVHVGPLLPDVHPIHSSGGDPLKAEHNAPTARRTASLSDDVSRCEHPVRD